MKISHLDLSGFVPALQAHGPKIVLHVGCGSAAPARLPPCYKTGDWTEIRVDIDERVKPDIVATLTNLSEIESSSVDSVWSSHSLEHLNDYEVPQALEEFLRVLKPGGFALITLPDLSEISKLIVQGKSDEVIYVSPAGPIRPIDMLFGHQVSQKMGNEYMAHRTGFTAERLGRMLASVGFHQTRVMRGKSFDLWAIGVVSTEPSQKKMTRRDPAAASATVKANHSSPSTKPSQPNSPSNRNTSAPGSEAGASAVRAQKKTAPTLAPASKKKEGASDDSALGRLIFPEWYLRRYPDVARASMDPIKHFLEKGWREGRNPNPIFETSWYLDRYSDVKRANINPLAHFLKSGNDEGRDPGRLFSTAFYLDRYPDVKRAKVNALEHFIRSGYKEGRKPHPQFAPPPPKSAAETEDGLNYFEKYASILDSLKLPLTPQIPLQPTECIHVSTPVGVNLITAERVIARIQNEGRKRFAIVAANFGGRDKPCPLVNMEDADCYLFTDRQSTAVGAWIPVCPSYYNTDPKRMSLHIKTNLHRYFSSYDYVLWIDQNIIPTFNRISKFIDTSSPPSIGTYIHWGRSCVFEEAEAVIKSGREEEAIVAQQMKKYEAAGFPENFGLFETGVLLVDMKDPIALKVLRDWWLEIVSGAKRCQLSFTYALWKNSATATPLEPEGTTARNSNFFIYLNHD